MTWSPVPESFINAGKGEVWDFIRKKYVRLTPEEGVRQSLLHTLVNVYRYPPALIAVEKKITCGGQTKRFDLALYAKSGEPLLLAECKAPFVAINAFCILQTGVYNSALAARYLLLTNGKELFLMDTALTKIFTQPLPFSTLVAHLT
jgi:hypothetical protein